MCEGLADLLRKECASILEAAGAAGVAMPVDIAAVVLSETIRRVAVHVYPRARSGIRARQTQTTTNFRHLVPVLVERLLCSAGNERKRPKLHEQIATAATPFAREVPRLDLVKGPCLRTWAFFVATTTSLFGHAIGRERHPVPSVVNVPRPEVVRARHARHDRDL